jgi:copper chaperone CopZ
MTNTAEFTVVGEEKLHCEGCEQRVGRALKRLDGVREVEASYRSQRVEVDYDPGRVGEEEIRERLDLLGYEVASQGEGS